MSRWYHDLMAMCDVGFAMFVDVDRLLVDAAKKLVRLRREACAGRCEVCEAQFASAWAWRGELRRLQVIRRQMGAYSMVHMMAASMERGA